MQVAILGGSFDPVHEGHLQIAKYALKQSNIHEVWFVPTKDSPLKASQYATFQERCQMVTYAVAPYRHMKLCTIEGSMDGVSYTIRTVEYLQKKYPHIQFCWLIGDDQALRFDHWKEYERLQTLMPFYVFSRVQDSALPIGFHRIHMPLVDVSSTELRRGEKLYFIPCSVRRYMGEHALYLEEMVKAQMSEKRYLHTQSVARLCVALAKAHHLDEQTAYLCGLLHDVCKQMPYEKSLIWMRHHLPEQMEKAPALWHSYIGAYMVKHKYYINDPKIAYAIFHHSEGVNKEDYERILYLADKLEPLRGYDSSKEIEISMHHLKKGCEVVKEQQLRYLKQKGIIPS